jgi:hypothetical protein
MHLMNHYGIYWNYCWYEKEFLKIWKEKKKKEKDDNEMEIKPVLDLVVGPSVIILKY